MVFSGIYPVKSEDFEQLRESLDKLYLNDSSLVFIPETSKALGFGFRCGFVRHGRAWPASGGFVPGGETRGSTARRYEAAARASLAW